VNGQAVGGERTAAVRHAQRATGQAAAVVSMIATSRPFAEVAQQLLAARGSLDSLLVRLVELELSDCVPSREVRNEVDGLLRTALGHTASSRRALRSGHSRPAIPPSSTHRLQGGTPE
jgi:DNA-binding FrmR family transcriptional regulator